MQKTIKKFFTSDRLLVFSIIFLGVVLRIIRLGDLFHFTYDEEVFAFVGKRMFINHHIPLIGGVTPFHVHAAPYFYWLAGIVLGLSHLQPIGWGVFAACIAGFTMLILYIAVNNAFGKKTALIALILYSFSFYQNIFDRHFWGLVFDGMIAVVTFHCLNQILHKKTQYSILLALFFAFGIHADPTVMALILFALLSLLIFRPTIPRNHLFLASIIFISSFVPLVIFDLRHDSVNIKGLGQYIEEVKSGREGVIPYHADDVFLYMPRALARTLYVGGNTNLARQYSYCPQHALSRLQDVSPFFVIGIGILFLYIGKRRKQIPNTRAVSLLFIAFIATYIGITIYGVLFHGDLFDHYLSILFPLFFILVALGVSQVATRFQTVTIIALTIFSLVNVYQVLSVQHRFGYTNKIAAVQWAIQQTANKDFSLDVISSCFAYNGYRYLFYLYGKEPAKSYVDANFTYLYDKPPAQTHPKLLVVITNPDFTETPEYYEEYNRYKTKEITSRRFGAIEVLIIDNSNYDFLGKF